MFRTIFIVAAMCVFVAMPARAQELNIAIIDMSRIMKESKAAKSIDKQLEDHREKFQSEFSDLERKLIEKEKKLSEELSNADREQIQAKRESFEKELLDSRQLVQKRKRSLEVAASKALIKFRDEVTASVKTISEKEGYNLVLTKQDVVVVERSLDITDKVIKQLDDSIKKIELDVKLSN
jgi:Skp family chaperone for outer membrane proteins